MWSRPKPEANAEPAGFESAKARLVEHVRERGHVRDERILEAFRRVPRHLFVPRSADPLAYNDSALPIGLEQTISQPSMIAIMLAALELKPSDRVLEIGAGSGYAAALLAELAREVYSVEILPELAAAATARLAALGYRNAEVVLGNGQSGLRERAPFDKILVSAGAREVPDELVNQLAPLGRIAIPVGDDVAQRLLVGSKGANGELCWERSVPCIFVPLVGDAKTT